MPYCNNIISKVMNVITTRKLFYVKKKFADSNIIQ